MYWFNIWLPYESLYFIIHCISRTRDSLHLCTAVYHAITSNVFVVVRRCAVRRVTLTAKHHALPITSRNVFSAVSGAQQYSLHRFIQHFYDENVVLLNELRGKKIWCGWTVIDPRNFEIFYCLLVNYLTSLYITFLTYICFFDE